MACRHARSPRHLRRTLSVGRAGASSRDTERFNPPALPALLLLPALFDVPLARAVASERSCNSNPSGVTPDGPLNLAFAPPALPLPELPAGDDCSDGVCRSSNRPFTVNQVDLHRQRRQIRSSSSAPPAEVESYHIKPHKRVRPHL
jgi:hypothetical protein